MNSIRQEDIILFSEKGMGNGLVRHIKDVIYFDRDAFDKRFTEEMAAEISQLNEKNGSREAAVYPHWSWSLGGNPRQMDWGGACKLASDKPGKSDCRNKF